MEIEEDRVVSMEIEEDVGRKLDIWFDDDHIFVHLVNGVEICTSLKHFPRLMKANSDQRNKWELIGRGIGIHWEEIDEDISIKTLLRYSDSDIRNVGENI